MASICLCALPHNFSCIDGFCSSHVISKPAAVILLYSSIRIYCKVWHKICQKKKERKTKKTKQNAQTYQQCLYFWGRGEGGTRLMPCCLKQKHFEAYRSMGLLVTTYKITRVTKVHLLQLTVATLTPAFVSPDFMGSWPFLMNPGSCMRLALEISGCAGKPAFSFPCKNLKQEAHFVIVLRGRTITICFIATGDYWVDRMLSSLTSTFFLYKFSSLKERNGT